MPSVHVIVVAGGSGRRFGGPVPKQWLPIDGEPVYVHTLRSLRAAMPACRITMVVSGEYLPVIAGECAGHGVPVDAVALGGATRWESVRNGLATVADGTDYVMVHDCARPFPSPALVSALLDALDAGAQGAVPAVAVTDSLRTVGDAGNPGHAVDRSGLRAVQTPQAFRADLLHRAYRLPYSPAFTDDASVMDAAGFRDIALTEGDPDNIKITNPRDLAVARLILADRKA